jgi:hypothetical protein
VLLALSANIRPSWKGLPGTNKRSSLFGLSVSDKEKKGFLTLTSEENCCNQIRKVRRRNKTFLD